ncbi:tRNA guanosine(34) transglycosylase Tgt [Candidatus Azambacteria bacterium]|nr:tRNA guanosine(34) transglycosylase Tgt [Candidatus Azambacteria bacterium]
MIKFKIVKKSKKSGARIGILKTPHGEIETPTLVPVATQAVVKTLTSEEAEAAKCQILIANTFHLHLKPGEKIVKSAGGIHKFMNWRHPLMTDSGGFQVFSLGFGHDLGVGKISAPSFGKNKDAIIDKNAQPKKVKITSGGVYFKSPIDGRELFIGPRESIKIQEAIGADIIFAFDECTPPLSTKSYIETSLRRTHDWAKICIASHKTNQALFGIVQGSKFKDLRGESARIINSLGFDGFGIGGDLGESKADTKKIISWVLPHLEESKPRHLLGIGKIEDIENIVKSGIDLFDCTVPTHYGRRGIAFVSSGLPAVALAKAGKLNLNKSVFLKDKKPLDSKCACSVCQNYKRSYIAHLLKAGEITAMRLLTFHNLHFFNTYVEKVREKIKNGLI